MWCTVPLPHPQVGLNGVDNGAIRFTSVRVPRENLLDRFATGGRVGQRRPPTPRAAPSGNRGPEGALCGWGK